MTVTVTEIKLGVDILARLFKFFKGISNNKKGKTILSQIYREILLGDKSDFSKIESMLIQMERIGDVSPEYLKAKEYFDMAKSSKPAAKSFGTAKKVIKKKSATRVGKPTCRKVAKKPSHKRSVAKRA